MAGPAGAQRGCQVARQPRPPGPSIAADTGTALPCRRPAPPPLYLAATGPPLSRRDEPGAAISWRRRSWRAQTRAVTSAGCVPSAESAPQAYLPSADGG